MKPKLLNYTILLLSIGVACWIFTLVFPSKYPSLNIICATIYTTLIPTSIVALIYEVQIRKTFIKELKHSMDLVIDEKFDPISNLNKSGITDCYKKISPDTLDALLRKSEDKILICKSFLPSLISIEDELALSIKRGVKLQICLTKPESDFSKYRSKILNREESYLSRETKSAVLNLKHFMDKHNFDDSDIEIRFHSEFLPVSYHQFDDKILIGILLSGNLANQNPIIKVEGTSSPIYKNLKEHYTSIWENSEKIDWDTIQ